MLKATSLHANSFVIDENLKRITSDPRDSEASGRASFEHPRERAEFFPVWNTPALNSHPGDHKHRRGIAARVKIFFRTRTWTMLQSISRNRSYRGVSSRTGGAEESIMRPEGKKRRITNQLATTWIGLYANASPLILYIYYIYIHYGRCYT